LSGMGRRNVAADETPARRFVTVNARPTRLRKLGCAWMRT